MSSLKCPICQSTDIDTFRDNPDDHGMCWETYHKCKNCGRIARDYNWEKLTETEKLTVENQRLTAEIERLKKQVADREDEGYAGFVIGVEQMKKRLAEKDKEIARLRLQNMKLKKLINEDLFYVLTNYLPKKQVFSEIIGLLRIKYDCITGKDTNVPANAPDTNDGTKGGA